MTSSDPVVFSSKLGLVAVVAVVGFYPLPGRSLQLQQCLQSNMLKITLEPGT